jgi:regulator of protease activity HflC (stomatin/prohibitin superfamily)
LFLLIGGIVIALIALVAAAATRQAIIAVLGVIVAVVMIIFSTVYTQEVGEALVVKNANGTIDSVDTTPGFGTKAPWQDTISFDIKNQQALYKLDGKATSPNEQVDGPTIAVTTSDKASSDVDIAVRYSIDGSKVGDIYTDYKTEQALFERLIAQDLKTVVRDSGAGFTVDTLLTERERYAKLVTEKLNERWAAKGIIVESVAPQAIRPPQSITDRITASQAAQQALVQAEADTKVKQEQAKQRVIEAQGVADANRVTNESLTDKILQNKYIDAMANAKNLSIVPQGSSFMQTLPTPAP